MTFNPVGAAVAAPTGLVIRSVVAAPIVATATVALVVL